MSVMAKWKAGVDRLLRDRGPRERRIIVWGAAASLLLVLVYGIWIPLQQAQARLERSVAIERKRLAVMGAAKLELASIEKPASQQKPSALSRQAIEELARTQLAPTALDIRMEGERGVRIAFSGVPMPKLIEWIDGVSRTQRIHVVFARLRQEGAVIGGELHLSGPDP